MPVWYIFRVADFLAKIRGFWTTVKSTVLKTLACLMVVTSWVLFCWGVFQSNSAQTIICLVSIAFSLAALGSTMALWVFYLAKQFSTHSIKVMDIKESIQKKRPVIAKAALSEDDLEGEEKPLMDYADSVVGQMFGRTKERFNDPLT